MDEFVRGKLNEWGLSEYIQIFKDEAIDEKVFKRIEKQDIEQLIPKVGSKIKFRQKFEEFKRQLEQEGSTGLTEVQPSTIVAGKRKRDLQGESSKQQTPAKRNCMAESQDAKIWRHVKEIMDGVLAQLNKQNDTDLNQFLKKNIEDLETDKRELVGVFGQTGVGKSSLINAVIGEKNLLPSTKISACTSVITKVESNMQENHYEAEIEFIGEEEWRAEVWSMLNFLETNPDEEGSHDEKDEDEDDNNDDIAAAAADYDNTVERRDIIEKLSALYGENWSEKSYDELIDRKNFKDIREFWKTPKAMILKCKTAEELSAELKKYTTNVTYGDVNVRYWPLVKCVTVKVPQNPLLQHVTLVDIPGNGDCNKSRDTMWKQIIGNCSTVWIVSEMNRGASNKASWEILDNAHSLIGNGGECRQIHYICSKSEDNQKFIDCSEAELRTMLNDNEKAKEFLKKEFQKLKKMKYFSFEVFTVSSRWFQEMKDLNVERTDLTEIPKLQDVLQNLNDSHSETLNYVSGACGILSLIQGSSLTNVAGNSKDVCDELDRNMTDNVVSIKQAMKAAEDTFDQQLKEGVEKSKRLWENRLKGVINPPKKSRRGFHRVLKCLVENQGIYKTKKQKEININMKLSSVLTECINENFRNTFPNESKCGPFDGVINKFSLGTEKLKTKYKVVELQLIFLKTEEEKMKTRLIKIIRDRKKKIYHSLTENIEQAMKECYDSAAEFSGRGTLNNMIETIKNHVKAAENTLFEEAKNAMLGELHSLTEEILRELEDTLKNSIRLSLMTNQSSPDVAAELEEVQQNYNLLKNSLNEERA